MLHGLPGESLRSFPRGPRSYPTRSGIRWAGTVAPSATIRIARWARHQSANAARICTCSRVQWNVGSGSHAVRTLGQHRHGKRLQGVAAVLGVGLQEHGMRAKLRGKRRPIDAAGDGTDGHSVRRGRQREDQAVAVGVLRLRQVHVRGVHHRDGRRIRQNGEQVEIGGRAANRDGKSLGGKPSAGGASGFTGSAMQPGPSADAIAARSD